MSLPARTARGSSISLSRFGLFANPTKGLFCAAPIYRRSSLSPNPSELVDAMTPGPELFTANPNGGPFGTSANDSEKSCSIVTPKKLELYSTRQKARGKRS